MVTNPYFIRARLFPTVLTAIPLLIFANKLLTTFLYDTLKAIYDVLPLLSSLGLSAALLFLSIQLNRLVAKEIFQKLYFKDELQMPTTIHLLWKDSFFDDTIKEKIRLKIHQLFGILLMNPPDESSNEEKSKKQIVTAVSQIRNSLRGNKLLFQHNIEYGFFRNLIGGSAIAILFSVALIVLGYFQKEKPTIITGTVLLIIYLLPIFFSLTLIRRFGNYYSKILYEQFLTIKHE